MDNILGPKNFRGILGETLTIFGRNFQRLLAIMAIPQIPLILIYVFIFDFQPNTITEGGVESPNQFTPLIILTFFLYIAFTHSFTYGALIHAVSERYLRQTIGIGRAYCFALEKLGALIKAMIIYFLVLVGTMMTSVILATLTFKIPYAGRFISISLLVCTPIYFTIRWSFIWQATLLEGLGPRAALLRSSVLTKGNWWKVFCVMFAFFIISSAISTILAIIVPKIGILAEGIVSFTLLAVAHTLLYYDMRVRKGGYSFELLTKELRINIDSLDSAQNVTIST